MLIFHNEEETMTNNSRTGDGRNNFYRGTGKNLKFKKLVLSNELPGLPLS